MGEGQISLSHSKTLTQEIDQKLNRFEKRINVSTKDILDQ